MPNMVSFVKSDSGSGTVCKPGPTTTGAPTQFPVRHRKQTLMSRFSDSGFEEDLEPSPSLSPAQVDLAAGRPEEPATGQLSTWYLQYGDLGFKIQREKEAQFHASKSLARQPQLTAEARCTLVSWLIPVHKHFCLSFECCCLAVNIMDRFLASTPVAADCFQLLGVTALLLASKQVEVCSPSISHLLSFCCNVFTKEQLCNLECLILVRLNFRLAAPTLAFFLDYYSNCIEAAQLTSKDTNLDPKMPRRCSSLAQKVCELSLADYSFNKYHPSLTASCALRLATDLLKTGRDLVEHATRESQEGQCTQSVSVQSPEVSEGSSQGSYNHSLAQECRDNLSLLVSLNQEILEM